MKHRVLLIGRWVVDFLFAEEGYDPDGVLACLYDAHAPQEIMDQAEDLMVSCRMNCGFTYSNAYRKRAIVLIGPTTSGEEFVNTLAHELYHLSVSIADNLGIDLLGERPAYMIGETMREFADLICRMGCDRCRQEE